MRRKQPAPSAPSPRLPGAETGCGRASRMEEPALEWICIPAGSSAGQRVGRASDHWPNTPLTNFVPVTANFQRRKDVLADLELSRRPGGIPAGALHFESILSEPRSLHDDFYVERFRVHRALNVTAKKRLTICICQSPCAGVGTYLGWRNEVD